mmetsp:Transcript_25702/g.44836  ORF Transcript_25702/g.44836 Transcript_25702/m.44836 type:complete len:97 (+) Transcript_25702:26-316(+)
MTCIMLHISTPLTELMGNENSPPDQKPKTTNNHHHHGVPFPISKKNKPTSMTCVFLPFLIFEPSSNQSRDPSLLFHVDDMMVLYSENFPFVADNDM